MIVRLRGRGLGELRLRTRQAAANWLERAGWSADAREPDDVRFARLVAPGIPTDAEALLGRFRVRMPPLARGLSDPRATAAFVRAQWPSHAQAIVERADRIVAGRFDLLGYHELAFGDPIDWQLDPVSGRRGTLVHWSRLPYLDAHRVGDHKVIWELNRHQHFVTLGQAWSLTDDPGYAECLMQRLEHWMDANPPKLGMNWASALEVAFRAISWVWALALVRHSPVLTPARFARALGMLHLHGRHVELHLSTFFSPNTHLTGEALGLAVLAAALPELRRAGRWLQTGHSVLVREIDRQLHGDGVYFEQSTYYHRYTVDFYLHLALLLECGGEHLPRATLDRVANALDYLVALVRPDGCSPLLGDEDSGRVVKLAERAPNDFRDTIALGGALLERPECCFAAGSAPPELGWLLGPDAVSRFEKPGRTEPAASVAFPEGGYVVMRSGWDRDGDYLLLDCGPHGRYGHAHADALAIELVAGGEPILTDAGTFTYVADPDARDCFRAGPMHSSVTVAGKSASIPDGPFRWRAMADARLERWVSTAGYDFARGAHNGFRRLDPPATHRREVLFLRGWRCWIVRDRIVSARTRAFTAHFHSAPGITIEFSAAGARFVSPHGTTVSLTSRADTGETSYSLRDSWHSSAYGARERVAALDATVTEGSELVTLLAAGTAAAVPDMRVERDAATHGFRIDLSGAGRRGVVEVVGNEWRIDGAVVVPPEGD